MKTRLLWAGILLGGVGLVLAQEKKPDTAPPGQSGGEIRTLSADEQAIRAADQAFVNEYNRGDTKTLAAWFTEDAEVVEADGSRYRGRPLIEGRLAETFAASPGVKLVLETESIQFLSPDVAKEEGSTIITPARGAGEARRHTALLVKRDGRWLISSIREEEEPLVRPHARLEELAWMIGEWVDEGTDSHVRVSCRWSDDANFLIRTFAVKAQGKPALTVHQRIGWDPLARQFHSWEFDSEGGYGEGRWSRDGDRWVIKHTGVRPEGVTASATHIMARVRPDLVRWAATDRVLGSESLPQEEDYVMVRVPPPPNVPATVPVPASPAAQGHQEVTMIRKYAIGFAHGPPGLGTRQQADLGLPRFWWRRPGWRRVSRRWRLWWRRLPWRWWIRRRRISRRRRIRRRGIVRSHAVV